MVQAMKRCCVLLVIAGAGVIGQNSSRQGLLISYYPSFCRLSVYPAASCDLVVFRDGQRRTSLELPVRADFIAYARNGTALYSISAGGPPICVERVEFIPMNVTSAACPSGLTAVFDFTVSGDETELLLSGRVGDVCGIFEIRRPSNEIHEILRTEHCGSDAFKTSWTSLAFSPDGKRALAVRHSRLELINLADRSSRDIAGEVSRAAWSPDGNRIAVIKSHGGTELIGAADFRKIRALPESTVEWSPDSRYLLRVRECRLPLAVNCVGTIQAVDVATGKVTTIESSRCAVDGGSTGWVRIGPGVRTRL